MVAKMDYLLIIGLAATFKTRYIGRVKNGGFEPQSDLELFSA
jgi:hypothetical protein